MRTTKTALLGAAAIGVLASAPVAFAQDAAEDESARTLGTITVTAQRKAESIQDVGATINAFGGEELAEARFTDVEDVATLVPNVDVKSALGGQNQVVTIRGVGLNDFSSNNTGSVGVYIDDIFLASVAALEFGMFDSERLEILKGPQGTLYGRNATGGAINIISQRPLFENGGYVRVGAGDFGMIEGEGAFNTVLGENVALRLSGRASTQESFYDNSITGSNLGDREAWGLRGQLAFRGDGWDGNLKIQTSSDEGPSTPYNLIGTMTPQSSVDAAAEAALFMFPEFATLLATDPSVGLGGVGAFCAPVLAGQLNPTQCADLTGFQDPTSEIRDTTSNFAGGNLANINTDDVTLHLNWDLGGGELTSITGWRSLDREFGEDTDGQSRTLFEYNHQTDVEQWSQELRYAWSNENTDIIVGGFYSYDDVTVRNNILSDELFLTNLLVTVDQETTSYAAFGNVEYEVAPNTTLIGGLRFTREEKDYAGGTQDLNPFGISLLLLDPATFAFFPDPLQLSFSDTSLEEDDISGKVGIEYRPSEDVLLYGTISKGFKSGGVIGDITFSNEELTPFDPETVYAYEAGIRSDLTDTFRFNGAVFYYDYQDVQTFVQGSLGPVLGNVDEATVVGADLEFVWAPTANLTLNGGLGLLDTELGGVLYDGNSLPNAPEQSFTGGVTYEHDLGPDSTLTFASDLKYASDVERNAENDPLTTTEAYTIVNARVAYNNEASGWGLALWGKNIFEEDFAEQTYNLPTVGIVIEGYNAPATWGVTLSKEF